VITDRPCIKRRDTICVGATDQRLFDTGIIERLDRIETECFRPAFFGTGKPAAVVTTMIFGGTPVVRLTVLGLRGVPENVREAAISFGASKWYLLTKVDLPLAAPSIRAGVNQTIMLSLAMVVVASLIGAKGLGEDVLEALQYANVGQGILAGFAILFCAMMLDRIVQGRNR